MESRIPIEVRGFYLLHFVVFPSVLCRSAGSSLALHQGVEQQRCSSHVGGLL